MVKAVIFDWGGVLIDNPTQSMISYIAEALGIAKEVVYPGVDQSLMVQFQKGHVTEAQVWERICNVFDVPKPDVHSLWKEAFEYAYRPREEMFCLVSELKRGGYRIGFLSNTEAPAMEFFFEQGYDLFDVTVFSCAEGTVKPEPLAYKIVLQRLGVAAKEAIFIDDRPEFIIGARAVGLHAILFDSAKQVRKDLRAYAAKLTEEVT